MNNLTLYGNDIKNEILKEKIKTKGDLFNILNDERLVEEIVDVIITPLNVVFMEDSYMNKETKELVDDEKLNILALHNENVLNINTFSYTLKKAFKRLIGVYGEDLPNIKIKNVLSNGKQRYIINVVEES